jgi:hypothetical protein
VQATRLHPLKMYVLLNRSDGVLSCQFKYLTMESF